jgi:hypothetical protein
MGVSYDACGDCNDTDLWGEQKGSQAALITVKSSYISLHYSLAFTLYLNKSMRPSRQIKQSNDEPSQVVSFSHFPTARGALTEFVALGNYLRSFVDKLSCQIHCPCLSAKAHGRYSMLTCTHTDSSICGYVHFVYFLQVPRMTVVSLFLR